MGCVFYQLSKNASSAPQQMCVHSPTSTDVSLIDVEIDRLAAATLLSLTVQSSSVCLMFVWWQLGFRLIKWNCFNFTVLRIIAFQKSMENIKWWIWQMGHFTVVKLNLLNYFLWIFFLNNFMYSIGSLSWHSSISPSLSKWERTVCNSKFKHKSKCLF